MKFILPLGVVGVLTLAGIWAKAQDSTENNLLVPSNSVPLVEANGEVPQLPTCTVCMRHAVGGTILDLNNTNPTGTASSATGATGGK